MVFEDIKNFLNEALFRDKQMVNAFLFLAIMMGLYLQLINLLLIEITIIKYSPMLIFAISTLYIITYVFKVIKVIAIKINTCNCVLKINIYKFDDIVIFTILIIAFDTIMSIFQLPSITNYLILGK